MLKLKIPHVVRKAVWDQEGDIRDVISIGKLVRKSDGPEEVEQILSTMMSIKKMKSIKNISKTGNIVEREVVIALEILNAERFLNWITKSQLS